MRERERERKKIDFRVFKIGSSASVFIFVFCDQMKIQNVNKKYLLYVIDLIMLKLLYNLCH